MRVATAMNTPAGGVHCMKWHTNEHFGSRSVIRKPGIELKYRTPFEWLIAGCAGVGASIVFFWPALSRGPGILPGTLGDSLFLNAIVEHWYRVIVGSAIWTSPAMFYPTPGTLGYSDAIFLYLPLYAAGRGSGLSVFAAFTLTEVLLLLIGYVGALWWLRRIAQVPFGIAVIGAILFAYSNMNVFSVGHPQLYATAFVPFIFGSGVLYARRLASGGLQLRIGTVFAVLLALTLYTSYYVGWFSTFFLLLWAAVIVLGRVLLVRGSVPALMGGVRRSLPSLLLVSIVFFVAIIPFVLTYLPIYRELGSWSWATVRSMLPRVTDLVNVAGQNLVWGWIERFLIEGTPEWEKHFGFPCALLLVFAATTGVSVWQLFTRSRKESANRVDASSYLAASLGLAVVVCWLLMLRYDDTSAWKVIYALVPGASALRAVFRLQTVLALPLITVAAIGLSSVWKHSGSSKLGRFALVAIVGFLLVEQFNPAMLLFDAHAETVRLSRVQPPPSYCQSFFVAEGTGANRAAHTSNLEAVVLALRFALPTLNGYSGSVPPNWGLQAPLEPEYAANAAAWIRSHGIADGVCALNLDTGSWWKVRPETPAILNENLVRFVPSSVEQGLGLALSGFYPLEAQGRWTKGSACITLAEPAIGQRLIVEGETLVGSARANNSPMRLRIRVNKHRVYDASLPAGPFRLSLPLQHPVGEITFDSETYIPKYFGIHSDVRQLGIMLNRVQIE